MLDPCHPAIGALVVKLGDLDPITLERRPFDRQAECLPLSHLGRSLDEGLANISRDVGFNLDDFRQNLGRPLRQNLCLRLDAGMEGFGVAAPYNDFCMAAPSEKKHRACST